MEQPQTEKPSDEKQCRICLDGVSAEPELGRLISPCQCKGSIRYVHLKCLHQWRQSSSSQSAFFACPQCHYRYRFARTQITGLATNKIVIVAASSIIFVSIVMVASFITTYFMSLFEEPTVPTWSYFRFISPIEVAHDLITAAFRILRDGDFAGILSEDGLFTPEIDFQPGQGLRFSSLQPRSSGVVMSFIRRFLLGLPLVGAASIVHLLLSFQFLAPVHWLARYRASRRRRDGSRDIAALIVLLLVLGGALRAFYHIYKKTEDSVKRMLTRAEDAILEVNS
ncbi:hypothetical protein FA15DRAFT_662285 [Coprinopsis marcescibilis]|uniref:Uncharacterized protein n=1 Tax=Coprinopsis marcescibilis TaxID=230819 RepID=A0A5C3LD13_COPMA|nr:hypothetical protein FA15DRAFT_662285 [Coprinopsis marcescibilis]